MTSLSFEQEPEYGEGESSADISQYPLEDILDRYYVAVEDFYGEINDGSYTKYVPILTLFGGFYEYKKS